MRAVLTFSSPDDIILPLSYNHLIQAFIYQNISNLEMRQKLHDDGVKYEKRRLKFFTFSRLNGRFKIDNDLKKIRFSGPISLTFSLYDKLEEKLGYDYFSDILSNMMKNDNLYIGENKVTLSRLIPVKYEFSRSLYYIKMISPILLYKSEIGHQTKFRKYVSPWDPEFNNLVIQNLHTKTEALGMKLNKEDFNITTLNRENSTDGKIIGFKNFKFKAYYGTFKLQGEREIIKLVYDSGIGAGNSAGFGCFDIIG